MTNLLFDSIDKIPRIIIFSIQLTWASAIFSNWIDLFYSTHLSTDY
jgi:hypothetical protein